MKNGNAENIVREFEDYIKKSGYIVSRTVHPQISECIKEESDGIAVIQLVDLTDSGTEKEYTDPAVDYGILREQTENVISTCGGENVQVMTLIFADGYEAALPVMRDDPMCWVIETGIPRLVLDELRIKDFHGLRNSLLNFIMQVSSRNTVADKEAENPVPAVISLIVINVLIFLYTAFVSAKPLGMGMMDYDLVSEGQVYRLITAMFLHSGIDHISGNMLSLFFMGTLAERAAGSVKFTVIYMLSGIAGNIASFYYEMFSGSRYTSVGASGAIYGILGAVIFLALKKSSGLNVTGRRLFIAVAYCIYSSFAMPGIDYAAHIGGLIAGFIICALTVRTTDAG